MGSPEETAADIEGEETNVSDTKDLDILEDIGIEPKEELVADTNKDTTESDLFEDVSDGGSDLLEKDPTSEIPAVTVEIPREEEIFGLDKVDMDNDLFGDDEASAPESKEHDFGGRAQQCDDLFDDDDEEEEMNEGGLAAIPVRTNSDHDQVPYNTPAVGCALDDAKTTALLNAVKETTQQTLQRIDSGNGDKKAVTKCRTVVISSYTRIGEGYSSYIVYTLQTSSENTCDTTVQRRFSDFVVLHQLLMENYLPRGVIVPPAPEKDFMGTAKVRFGSSNQSSGDKCSFVKRRKASLERYLNRLMGHHLISKDETLRRFLEEEEPPRPNPNASGIKGFMKNMETMVSKATAKINEVDEWYEDKQQHIIELEETLKKLLVVVDNMVGNRRELSVKSSAFASSCLTLGEGEDNVTLRRAVTKLSELEAQLERVHLGQSDTDLFTFGETVKDYISLIQSAKAAFDERVRTFSTWESAQSTLAKKRDAKNKAIAQGKAERVTQCEEDIKFWEGKVEKCQEDFEMISKNLKNEIRIFEEVWVREIKEAITTYFQKTIENQKQIVGHWKEFLPEAKIIN